MPGDTSENRNLSGLNKQALADQPGVSPPGERLHKVRRGDISSLAEMSNFDFEALKENPEQEAHYHLLLESLDADLKDTQSAVTDVLLPFLSISVRGEAQQLLDSGALDMVSFYEIIHECGVSLKRAIRSRRAEGSAYVWDGQGVRCEGDIVATQDELEQTVAVVRSCSRSLAAAMLAWSRKAARELPCLFAGLETWAKGADAVELRISQNTYPNPKERWGHFLREQSQR